MSIEVRLPDLGGAITHAKLSAWLKQAGERVSQGEPIAEIETDKTSVEIEAPGTGVLADIRVPAGTDHVAVNDLLALISAVDARRPGQAGDAGRTALVSGAPVSPDSAGAANEEHSRPTTAPGGVAAAGDARLAAPSDGVAAESPAVPASPLARRMAHAAGIPLHTIKGTGPNGRVTKVDVEAVLRPVGRATAPVADTIAERPKPAAPDDAPSRYERVPLSTMQRISAARLTAAKQEVPHFYLQVDCDMDAVERVRAELNARGAAKYSVTAFALRAAALALVRVPAANAAWDDGAVRRYRSADLAVAVNTPGGLIAPVIRNAQDKSVTALNAEVRELAARARAGRLKPEEYAGGTCTVSNLGMFGVTSLYAIVNPPQACILGLGAVTQRPVVRDNAPAVGLVLTATLSADHRAIDGAVGAEFLGAFRQLMQDPWSLLM